MKNQKYETNHTFAVCAYKESPYLDECLQSLVSQSVKTNIILCTSTPNDLIKSMAEKYDIPMFVRDGQSDIRDDWNFAYDSSNTDYVTIAHQDDLYHKDYVKTFVEKRKDYKDIIIFFPDYMPIKNGIVGKRDKNNIIRHMLRTPMKFKMLANKKFWKKRILSLGNTIVCPLVTYNKKMLGPSVFTSELKFNIDWDTFLKLANYDGRFLYADSALGFYRIHDGATSKEFIVSNTRVIDDTVMFNKFWPKWVTKLIMKVYVKAYDTYSD